MIYKIILLGRIPSKKNSKQLIYNGGRAFLIPSKNYREWHKDASIQVLNIKRLIKQPLENVKMTAIFFAPDKRIADLSNKFESVADLLCDNQILKDDSWWVVGGINLIFGGLARKNPRVEITIEDVGSEADMAK